MSSKEEGASSPNRKLGRGLGALLSVPVRVPTPPGGPASAAASSKPPQVEFRPEMTPGRSTSDSSSSAAVEDVPRGTRVGPEIRSLPIDHLLPNPRQPRREFDESAIRGLSESIRTAGLMQPVVVRPLRGESDRFELIAGERRWRAAKLLGLGEIPAVVHEVNDQVAGEWALIENIQREDLNPIERSEALSRLVQEFSLTHQELAVRLGMDRVTITNLLRLQDLDPFTKEAVRKGELSQGHAKVLLGVLQPELRRKLASAALNGGLSVRELERRVKAIGSGLGTEPGSKDPVSTRKPHIQDLERRLSEHLGTKVLIQEDRVKKGKGHVIIDYYTLEQFEGLMAKMGFPIEL